MDLTQAFIEEVAARQDEVVALTQSLIRFPTVNPPGQGYEACARFIGQRLAQRGFEVEMVRADGGPGDSDAYPRWNVVARLVGDANGFCVHFNSHIDVVEVGTGWTVPPFSGLVQAGKVYGRGACDMKGGLAASIVACEAIVDVCARHGVTIPGTLELSGTADEESGGYSGVGHLASMGYFSKPRVHHVIIPEPLGEDRICLGHRGVFWTEVETKGRIAHGSMPFLGDSAIAHMGAFVQLLETRLQPSLALRHTSEPVEPPGARVATLNINSIHGGQSEQRYAVDAHGRPSADLPAPTVAHSCRAVLDRRFISEERLEDVKAEIVSMLEELKTTRPGFDYALREIMSFVPTATPRDASVVDATARAIARVLGREPTYISSPGTYDQKHIVRTGKLQGVIAYGPGILDLAHQPDEYVEVAALVHSAQVMALAAWSLMQTD